MAASVVKSIIKSSHRLPPLPTIRDLIRLFKLRALKQFSQNFLMDQRLTTKIVKSAGRITDGLVLEVGPGPGSITRSILEQYPKHLVVVEKDRRFIPSLELLADATKDLVRMDIVRDDILLYQCEHAFPEHPKVEWEEDKRPNIHLIGNLPFAISTRLLINWLKDISLKRGAWTYGRSTMILTFQLEVAERIIAPISSDQRCRLSVMSQIWTKPLLKFTIPGGAFIPPPKVDVGVVTLIPLKTPLTTLPFDLVEKVLRYIFSMRQKYVRRGIANLYPPKVQEELTQLTFQMADVDPLYRSFQLSNEECLRLAESYKKIIDENSEYADYNYRAPKSERLEMM
ncbi:CLUMA_CG014405, isoform A [Clunio marinus]|uniref:rRNA adenine N(6)-methyltransferase n=1 Tax=Clunio marinus TaxID=568069 RepID=A0A1J1IMQ0_9DIPT|nr:CLUMA_CG014405, isoform A [Clunio marinus]